MSTHVYQLICCEFVSVSRVNDFKNATFNIEVHATFFPLYHNACGHSLTGNWTHIQSAVAAPRLKHWTTQRILQITFWNSFFFFFFQCIVRCGNAGSRSSSIFTVFEELPYCIPWQLHQFAFPTNNAQGFSFLYKLANIPVDSHSDSCEVISHFCLDLHFWWLAMLSIF